MMSTRGENLDRDRTKALERLAPRRAIETRNIEAFWERYDPGAAPPSLLAEAEELWDGKAVLVLPDGSRWVHVKALLRGDAGGDNRYVQRLLQLLLTHMALSEHVGIGGGVSDFSLDAASLDLRHVFCHECTRCLDLERDAAQVDVADGQDPR